MVIAVRGDVLVVPPFECAWLSEKNQACQALGEAGEGWFTFEAKGSNDVTLILNSRAGLGNKRIQPTRSRLQRQRIQANEAEGHECYTVIIGSHCNSRLVIERNAKIVHAVAGIRSSDSMFIAYWLSFNRGSISVGYGKKLGQNLLTQWQDAEPYTNIRSLGFSTWDKYVCYKRIQGHSGPALSLDLTLPLAGGRLRAECTGNGEGKAASSARHVRSSNSGSGDCGDDRGGRPRSLQHLCVDKVSEGLTVDTCVRILCLAEDLLPDTDALFQRALDALCRNFVRVVEERPEEARLLSEACLEDILQRDRLDSVSEAWLFAFLVSWGGHAVGRVEKLLPLIRFPQMSRQELERVQASAMHGESAVLATLVGEAMETHGHESGQEEGGEGLFDACEVAAGAARSFLVNKERMIELHQHRDPLALSRRQPRQHPDTKELLYVSDGDTHGLLFYLGTNGHRSAFVNPSLTRVVETSTSAPHGRFTQPGSITSRQHVQTSYFDPQFDMRTGRKESWWQVDIGRRRRLQCNHYTLRHDSSSDFVRNWELRGSVDGKEWHVLRKHENDKTVSKPFQLASWPVNPNPNCRHGPRKHESQSNNSNNNKFRLFRIVLTGPNASKMTTHRLCMCWFELYGYLEESPF